MAADSGMENIQALIPIVGSGQGHLCGRDHTTICLRGRTYVWEMWNKIPTQRERERERERERDAQKVYLY